MFAAFTSHTRVCGSRAFTSRSRLVRFQKTRIPRDARRVSHPLRIVMENVGETHRCGVDEGNDNYRLECSVGDWSWRSLYDVRLSSFYGP